MTPTTNLRSRFESIRARIEAAAGSRIGEVTLLAVSKGQSADSIFELYQLGQRDFAENYAQELVQKAEDLKSRGCNQIRWHFIGHLQTNKVKAIIPHVSSIHSVDSEKLAVEISRRWRCQSAIPLSVFLEVNIGSEESKSGVKYTEVKGVVEKIAKISDLTLEGLMCIPAPGESAPSFEKLRKLELELRPMTHGKLSMGMSDDFEEAIRAGASHVRVGTALFGPRSA